MIYGYGHDASSLELDTMPYVAVDHECDAYELSWT